MEHDTAILRSSWSISRKFSLLVVAAAILSGAAIGISDYWQAADAMRRAAEAKLSAVLEARRVELAAYLDSIQRNLRFQTASLLVHDALKDRGSHWGRAIDV